MPATIYQLTLENIQNKIYRESISQDMGNDYYWSKDWSEEFYIELAKMGFISTTYDTKEGLILLPELQAEYGILDFKNLHISKKVQKLLNKNEYTLTFNTKLDEVIQQFSLQHRHNWLKDEYVQMIQKLYKNKRADFEIYSVELISNKNQKLIAGEIGYKIGKTYTSLSGFSSKEKQYTNCGKLQLVLLARYLQKEKFSFWNLGHPHMEYKKQLGSVTYSRKEFLKRWNEAISL